MKVITADDQIANAKGKRDSVPLVMMAASEIGARQGRALKRCRNVVGTKDTAVMAAIIDELDTARRNYRLNGRLKAAGFPGATIYRVPTKSNTSPARLTPVTHAWFKILMLSTG